MMKKQGSLLFKAAFLLALFVSPFAARAQEVSQTKTASSPPVLQENPANGEPVSFGPAALMERIRAMQAKGEKALVYVKEGRELLKMQKNDEAIASFKKALALDPLISPVYVGLIDAYTAKGDLTSAAQIYRAWLYPAPGKRWSTSDAGNPIVLMRFALVLNQIGKKDEALTVYRHGLEGLRYPDGSLHTGTFPLILDTTFDGRDSENIYMPARLEAAARTALAIRVRLESMVSIADGEIQAKEQLSRAMKANPRFGPAYLYYALTLKELARADKSITPEAVNAAFDVAAKMVHGTQAKAAVKAGREHY